MTKARYAPEGALWVCQACGKTAVDRYGHPGIADAGWDESCMLNAVLARAGSIKRGPGGRVVACEAVDPQPEDS